MKHQKIKEIASKINKHDFATIAALLRSADDGEPLQLPDDNALAYLNGSVLADDIADKAEYDDFYAAMVGPEMNYIDGIVNNVAKRYFTLAQDYKALDTLETTKAMVKNDLKHFSGSLNYFVLLRLRKCRDDSYTRNVGRRAHGIECQGFWDDICAQPDNDRFFDVEAQHCDSYGDLPKVGKQVYNKLLRAGDETLAGVALRLCNSKIDLADELLLDKNDIAILNTAIRAEHVASQINTKVRRRLNLVGDLLETNSIDTATDMTEILDAFRLAIHALVDRLQMEAAV